MKRKKGPGEDLGISKFFSHNRLRSHIDKQMIYGGFAVMHGPCQLDIRIRGFLFNGRALHGELDLHIGQVF